MALLTPKVPSERNVRIYYAVHAHRKRQADVARDNGLSQSRVSRICDQVEYWITLGKPGTCLSVETQAFIAADLWNERLAYYESQASQAFRQTCEPPANDEAEEKPRKQAAKPPKPDPRLLKQAVDCAREQYQLSSILSKARAELHRHLGEDPLFGEEMEVCEAQAACQEVGARHGELCAKGATLPPLPRFDAQAVELFARNRIRRQQPRNSRIKDYLPPEWSAIVTAVDDAPLAYPGAEVVLPPSPITNDQAYDQDSPTPSEPEEVITDSIPTPEPTPPCDEPPKNYHFDYTVLARRHKSPPPGQLPPIRWHRMT